MRPQLNSHTLETTIDDLLVTLLPSLSVPLDSDKRLSSFGNCVAGTLLVLISVFGTLHNLLVIIVMVKNRSLRTPVNLVLLNLSVSDTILAAIGSPLTAASAFWNQWYFDEIVCKLYAFDTAIAGIASITSLAFISFERYLLIKKPRSPNVHKHKTKLTIIGVWMYAFAVTFPPLIGWNSYGVESPGISCSINWESSTPEANSYILFLFVFGLFIPLTVIIFCYTHILLVIRQQTRKDFCSRVANMERKVTLMILLMIMAFLLAWTPYAVVSLMVVFMGNQWLSPAGAAAPAILAKSSIVYNPLIYVMFNPSFKEALQKLVPDRVYTLFKTKKEIVVERITSYKAAPASAGPAAVSNATTSGYGEPSRQVQLHKQVRAVLDGNIGQSGTHL